MPFARPTLTALRRQIVADLQTAPGASGTPLFRRAISQPLAWALANEGNGLYGYLDRIAKQSVPWTATDEYLTAWAALVGITPKPAVAWAGTATGTGVATTVLSSGTAISGAGNSYVTTANATVDAFGNITAPIAAVLAGTAYDLTPGDQIALSVAVPGINAAMVVASTTQPGVDAEQSGPFRTRMLQRYAAPPQGGDAADYLAWALAVPGVTRAWVNPLGLGAGTAVLYVMLDLAEAAHAGFPQGTNGVATLETRGTAATGDQLVVANALYPLRPVTAMVFVAAPSPSSVNFTIHSASTVSSPVRTAVAAAIDAAFISYASPLGTELNFGAFEAAIAAVSGMPAFTLEAPVAPVTASLGSLPVRGTVSYV